MPRGKPRRQASKSKGTSIEDIRKAVRTGLRRFKSKGSRKSKHTSRRSRSKTLDVEIRPKSLGRQFKEKVEKQKSARVVNILKMIDSSAVSSTASAAVRSSRSGFNSRSKTVTSPDEFQLETNGIKGAAQRPYLMYKNDVEKAGYDDKDIILENFLQAIKYDLTSERYEQLERWAKNIWYLDKVKYLRNELSKIITSEEFDEDKFFELRKKQQELLHNDFKPYTTDGSEHGDVQLLNRVMSRTLKALGAKRNLQVEAEKSTPDTNTIQENFKTFVKESRGIKAFENDIQRFKTKFPSLGT